MKGLQTNTQKYCDEDETHPVIRRSLAVLDDEDYVPWEKGEPYQCKKEGTLVKLVMRNLTSVVQLENVQIVNMELTKNLDAKAGSKQYVAHNEAEAHRCVLGLDCRPYKTLFVLKFVFL